MTIRAIETEYKGYRFRSRLEARWAVFFDKLGISWEYEKEGYDLGGGDYYLPDFYLPTVYLRSNIKHQGLWVEVKPPYIRTTPYKRPEYYLILEKFVKLIKGNLVLVHGVPEIDKEDNYQFACDFDYEEGFWWDNYMQFMKCYNPDCDLVKLEFLESNYETCPKCNTNCNADQSLVIQAIYAAKGARFEHGYRN